MSAIGEPAGAGVSPGKDPRVPPQSNEAEEAILGALLLDRSAIHRAMALLEPEHFYQPRNAEIFRAMVGLYERGEAVDIVTLTEELRKAGQLDLAGGASHLGGLQESVATGAHVEHYARIVMEKSTLRRMIEVSGQIVRSCFDGREEAVEILDQAERSIMAISQGRLRQGFQPVKEILRGTFENIQRVYESQSHITGVPSGYTELDSMTGGFQKSDLIIIAGRPSMGKTSLVLNVAQHTAIEEKKRVAFFSLEMSKEQLVQRLLTAEARIDAHKLRSGNLKDEDWPLLTEAAGQLADAPIYIDDTAAITVLEMRAKSRRLQSQEGLDLIVVDYLQLMRATGRSDNRQQEISEISRSLKALAKELGVPVLALSQLSRAVESRTDKRPQLSDLRECVTGDTLVCLADGRRVPIRELVGETPSVLSIDATGKLSMEISDKVWAVGRKPVFRIALASGRAIRATAEHRLLGADGWKEISKLKVGNRLGITRKMPEPVQAERWPELRVALLGQLIGDGSYLSGQPMRYCTGSEENSRIVTEAATREFGTTVKRYRGRGNWHQLLISGNGNRWHPAGVNKWLRELGIFGQRSHEKRIPQAAFRLANEQIALLLRHLWATDGSISVRKAGARGSNGVHFSTCSKKLADDVAALLLRLGIVARIHEVEQRRGRPVHMVMVSGSEAQRQFLKCVGAYGPKILPAMRLKKALEGVEPNPNVDTLPNEAFGEVKQAMAAAGISQRRMASWRGTSYGGTSHFKFSPSRRTIDHYAELLDSPSLREMSESDLFWDRIVGIEPAGEEEVYDLTVPGPACWLADGIVSHNSGALEQDADLVMFIYRPEVYEDDDEKEGMAEIIVGKQRNGPIGTARLAFIKEYTRFENLAQEKFYD